MKRLGTVLALLFLIALPVLAQSGQQAGQIIRADYGSGNNWVEVTERVRALIRGDSLNFRVTNDTFGVDPRPGKEKVLRIQIQDNRGRTQQLTFKENQYVSLQVLGGGPYVSARSGRLKINRAQYGAAGRFMDVTARLNSRIQRNQLSLQVTNDNMGGDPAVGKDKTLTVRYTYNGRPGRVAISEGNYLRLPDRNASYQSSNLQILRADYGAGNRFMDVTARLNSQIQSDQLSLQVTNENMGGDPAVGQDKTLRIQYTYNGRPGQVAISEGNYLRLPDSNASYQSSSLQILRADYGTGNRLMDVTARLNSQIQGDQLSLQVTNENMGGDPAVGQGKTLRVQYTYNGRAGQVAISEGNYLRLPDSNASYQSSSLQILRADYGAGNRFMDVTARLNSRIQGDQLNLQVTNDNMGGDPAVGQEKTLRVRYAYNGQADQVVVREGDYLKLSGDAWPGSAGAAGSRGYTTIPSGTQLSIRTNEVIDSNTATAGQKFSAVMEADVRDGSGAVAIPRGSDVELVIRSTAGSDLVLDIDSVIARGQRYLVSTGDLEQQGGQGIGANRRTAVMVGGGAALGALIGAIVGGGKGAAIGAGVGAAGGAAGQVLTKGKEVRVPAETVLNFKLDADLFLEPARW
ncbi:MAG TPA: DUF3395 domain-containing protein [Terriglobales bacterium]|nr:DUF3395 domain-containing protein [Terriglobales bacterium]